MYLNRESYAVLKYIYKHFGVSEGELTKRFDGETIHWILIALIKNEYIGGGNPNGQFLESKDPFLTTSDKTCYISLSKGDVVIENKRWELLKWLVPLIFSSLSLALGIVNLIIR